MKLALQLPAQIIVLLTLDGRLEIIKQQSRHMLCSCLESIWILDRQANRQWLRIFSSMSWGMLCRS